jgi:hypothetical protein
MREYKLSPWRYGRSSANPQGARNNSLTCESTATSHSGVVTVKDAGERVCYCVRTVRRASFCYAFNSISCPSDKDYMPKEVVNVAIAASQVARGIKLALTKGQV